MEKVYKVKDGQLDRYFQDGRIMTKEQVIENIADFHDVDYEGEKEDGTPYEDINSFLKTLKDDEQRLNWLLDYGSWELEEVSEKELLEWAGRIICNLQEFIEINDPEYYSSSENIAEANDFFVVADKLNIKYK